LVTSKTLSKSLEVTSVQDVTLMSDDTLSDGIALATVAVDMILKDSIEIGRKILG
jgi:hypothetical protein